MSRGHGKRLPPWVQRHGRGFRGWVCDAGRQRRGPVVATAAEAYAWAARERESAASSAQGRVTLELAMAHVRRDLELAGRRAGTGAWYECQFRALLEHWPGATRLAAITPQAVEAFVGARKAAGAGNTTVRHHLRALARLFALERRAGAVTGPSPTDRITLPTVEPALPRRMAWLEVESVLARVRAAGASADAALLEALFRTGLRRTELAWVRQGDLSGTELNVVHGKRRPRVLPVPPELARLLRTMPAPWIVLGDTEAQRVATVSRVCTRWRRALPEPRLTPHALRHSFATHLARKGVAEYVIAALLGHQLTSITARYIGAPWEHALAAMAHAWHD